MRKFAMMGDIEIVSNVCKIHLRDIACEYSAIILAQSSWKCRINNGDSEDNEVQDKGQYGGTWFELSTCVQLKVGDVIQIAGDDWSFWFNVVYIDIRKMKMYVSAAPLDPSW